MSAPNQCTGVVPACRQPHRQFLMVDFKAFQRFPDHVHGGERDGVLFHWPDSEHHEICPIVRERRCDAYVFFFRFWLLRILCLARGFWGRTGRDAWREGGCRRKDVRQARHTADLLVVGAIFVERKRAGPGMRVALYFSSIQK